MKQEHTMYGFPNVFITAERKRNIAYTATHFGKRHRLLYFTGCLNKIYCIIIMLFNTCCNGKNIGIKNNILRKITHLLC